MVAVSRTVRSAIEKARKRWRLFRGSEPGHRFQERYRRAARSRRTGGVPRWVRPANLVGGAALVAAGFAFLPTPGPSYIIIVLGLWMMSGQWLALARLFDRMEPPLRAWWKRAPGWAKALVGLALVALIAALAYLVFG